MKFAFLLLAVSAELAASSCLFRSNRFTSLWPTIGAVLFYLLYFSSLSHTLKYVPIGTTFSIILGAGVVLAALASAGIFRGQSVTSMCIGVAVIVIGVILLNSPLRLNLYPKTFKTTQIKPDDSYFIHPFG